MARTHAEVIEEHRVMIGATKIHVDYDIGCDPEDLADALARQWEVAKEYDAIDPVTQLEYKIAHYEELFSKIRRLCQTDVRDFVEQIDSNPELAKFKSSIFYLADMGMFSSQDAAIEFAKKKNAT